MQQANDEIYNKHDITAPTNLRQTLMNVMTPSLRDGPEAEVASINFRKALPKFLQLPTNRRIEDLQRKELVFPPESPKSDATVTKKASTPKSQRKTAKDTGFKTLPTCVADIPVTPDNKYGFLRSFDGTRSTNGFMMYFSINFNSLLYSGNFQKTSTSHCANVPRLVQDQKGRLGPFVVRAVQFARVRRQTRCSRHMEQETEHHSRILLQSTEVNMSFIFVPSSQI